MSHESQNPSATDLFATNDQLNKQADFLEEETSRFPRLAKLFKPVISLFRKSEPSKKETQDILSKAQGEIEGMSVYADIEEKRAFKKCVSHFFKGVAAILTAGRAFSIPKIKSLGGSTLTSGQMQHMQVLAPTQRRDRGENIKHHFDKAFHRGKGK